MNDAWNCYISAFKNAFDYKNIATRKELNWFIVFFMLFWFIMIILSMAACITLILSGKEDAIQFYFIGFIIFAILYFVVHIFPLIALIKRRFNLITPQKSGIFFGGWLIIWLIHQAASISMIFLANGMEKGLIDPLSVLPIAFIVQILGFITVGIIIFLMIREKPVN